MIPYFMGNGSSWQYLKRIESWIMLVTNGWRLKPIWLLWEKQCFIFFYCGFILTGRIGNDKSSLTAIFGYNHILLSSSLVYKPVFGKYFVVSKTTNIPINLKHLNNAGHTHSVMVYETESWTRLTAQKLQIIQRAIERAMLVISLWDPVRNKEIWRRTNLIEIAKMIASGKCKGTGCITVDDKTDETEGCFSGDLETGIER